MTIVGVIDLQNSFTVRFFWLKVDGLIVLISYLMGSIPFGYLVAKAHGIDIRQHGSGNIGATNVMRVLGKTPGYTVFACDALKGLLAVIAAKYIASHNVQTFVQVQQSYVGSDLSVSRLTLIIKVPESIAADFRGDRLYHRA